MGGELADSGKNGKIYCSRVEEQGPNYLLDPGLFRRRDWGREGGGRGGVGVGYRWGVDSGG